MANIYVSALQLWALSLMKRVNKRKLVFCYFKNSNIRWLFYYWNPIITSIHLFLPLKWQLKKIAHIPAKNAFFSQFFNHFGPFPKPRGQIFRQFWSSLSQNFYLMTVNILFFSLPLPLICPRGLYTSPFIFPTQKKNKWGSSSSLDLNPKFFSVNSLRKNIAFIP